MILYEVLNSTPDDEIVEKMFALEDVSENFTEEKQAVLCEEIRRFLHTLHSTIPDKSTPQIVFVASFVEDGKTHLEPWLFEKDQLNEYNRSDSVLYMALPNIKTASTDELIQWLLNHPFAPSYAIEFSHWNRMLGCEVSEPNVKDVGCADYLAAVFRLMTFFGFREESVHKKLDEIDQALAEAEEIDKLLGEDRKYLVPWDEIFPDDELEDLDQMDWDQLYRETAANRVALYAVVREYYRKQE